MDKAIYFLTGFVMMKGILFAIDLVELTIELLRIWIRRNGGVV